jgi:hypothetical protein
MTDLSQYDSLSATTEHSEDWPLAIRDLNVQMGSHTAAGMTYVLVAVPTSPLRQEPLRAWQMTLKLDDSYDMAYATRRLCILA